MITAAWRTFNTTHASDNEGDVQTHTLTPHCETTPIDKASIIFGTRLRAPA